MKYFWNHKFKIARIYYLVLICKTTSIFSCGLQKKIAVNQLWLNNSGYWYKLRAEEKSYYPIGNNTLIAICKKENNNGKRNTIQCCMATQIKLCIIQWCCFYNSNSQLNAAFSPVILIDTFEQNGNASVFWQLEQ